MSISKLPLYSFIWIVHSVMCDEGPHSVDDRMGRNDKTKMKWLTDDILRDSTLKMRQIIEIREEHEVYIAFSIGVIIGKIREKYRHMTEIYKDNLYKHKERTMMLGPGTMTFRPFHTMIALESMHYLFVEIDKLVDVVVSQATEELGADNLLVPGIADAKMKSMMRMGQEEVTVDEPEEVPPEEVIKTMLKEEETKSKIRQEYLMKRLGRPANLTTTRKRFMKQWPVEDTWSHEEYSVG